MGICSRCNMPAGSPVALYCGPCGRLRLAEWLAGEGLRVEVGSGRPARVRLVDCPAGGRATARGRVLDLAAQAGVAVTVEG